MPSNNIHPLNSRVELYRARAAANTPAAAPARATTPVGSDPTAAPVLFVIAVAEPVGLGPEAAKVVVEFAEVVKAVTTSTVRISRPARSLGSKTTFMSVCAICPRTVLLQVISAVVDVPCQEHAQSLVAVRGVAVSS